MSSLGMTHPRFCDPSRIGLKTFCEPALDVPCNFFLHSLPLLIKTLIFPPDLWTEGARELCLLPSA